MTEKNKNLIYLALFINPDFINLLELLLTSMKLYGKLDTSTTDVMIMTDLKLQPKIDEVSKKIGIPLQYYYLDVPTKWQSSAARLEIFKYEHIDKYNTILYIDTDILLHKDINTLLNLQISDEKLYAIGEGRLGDCYWGGAGDLFVDFTNKPYTEWTEAFCAGILLFKNSSSIRDLFTKINNHIYQYVFVEKREPKWWEQPFIVYNAVVENKYDNQLLKKYVVNNKFFLEPCDIVLYHFPCGPGWYKIKYENMMNMAAQQKEFYNPASIPKLVGPGFRTATNWLSFIRPGPLTPVNYLEIGVFCGHNIVSFERIYGRHPDSRLYGIDPWNLVNNEYDEKFNQTSNYSHCLTNILSTGKAEKFDLRKGFSHTEINRLNDDFFDFIYIDGNHNTPNVVEDAVLAFRKLKTNGYLIFDDYDWESVKKGVDTFAAAYSNKIKWVGIAWGQNFFKKI
jgi:hypothetical protein